MLLLMIVAPLFFGQDLMLTAMALVSLMPFFLIVLGLEVLVVMIISAWPHMLLMAFETSWTMATPRPPTPP